MFEKSATYNFPPRVSICLAYIVQRKCLLLITSFLKMIYFFMLFTCKMIFGGHSHSAGQYYVTCSSTAAVTAVTSCYCCY